MCAGDEEVRHILPAPLLPLLTCHVCQTIRTVTFQKSEPRSLDDSAVEIPACIREGGGKREGRGREGVAGSKCIHVHIYLMYLYMHKDNY